MSAIWIKYSSVVWAQPTSGQPHKGHGSKRVAWWPGVVIGGESARGWTSIDSSSFF